MVPWGVLRKVETGIEFYIEHQSKNLKTHKSEDTMSK